MLHALFRIITLSHRTLNPIVQKIYLQADLMKHSDAAPPIEGIPNRPTGTSSPMMTAITPTASNDLQGTTDLQSRPLAKAHKLQTCRMKWDAEFNFIDTAQVTINSF